jgi:AraC-like DNA-binding protein
MSGHRAGRAGNCGARLSAIKADIARHLGQPNLSVTAVAARQGVTPRYVQMLFEKEGTTFSKYVLGQRLALAHRLLADPSWVGRPIKAIAYEAGFSDLAYLSRAFHRRYGAPPSSMRQAAQASASVGPSRRHGVKG